MWGHASLCNPWSRSRRVVRGRAATPKPKHTLRRSSRHRAAVDPSRPPYVAAPQVRLFNLASMLRARAAFNAPGRNKDRLPDRSRVSSLMLAIRPRSDATRMRSSVRRLTGQRGQTHRYASFGRCGQRVRAVSAKPAAAPRACRVEIVPAGPLLAGSPRERVACCAGAGWLKTSPQPPPLRCGYSFSKHATMQSA